MKIQSATVSLLLHLALLIILIFAASNFSSVTKTSVITLSMVRPVPLYAPTPVLASSAPAPGGGSRSPLPPALGAIPRVSKVFIPPVLRTVENPQLVLPSGFEDAPVVADNLPSGVPNGIAGMRSYGPGDDGIGRVPGKNGKDGPGGNGPGGSSQAAGGKLSELPKVLFKIEPEYSEEARKARYQGNVLLAFDVDVDGKPLNIRVVQALGLGLDERAIAAVEKWRFKPGIRNGRPVRSPVSVEVSFRLL